MARGITNWLRGKRAAPSVPPDCRVYAVGDIHGRSDLLDRMVRLIRRDAAACSEKPILVFLGDYVDRGKDSKGVIVQLIDLQREFAAQLLRGNHDQVLLDFLRDPNTYRMWRDFGAVETLLSYGVRPPLSDEDGDLKDARDRFARALPAKHRAFLEALTFSWEIGDYFFSHAGVRPGTAFEEQRPADLMWIREEFLNSTVDFGKVVIHGHTPTETPVKKLNRIGVDTGAYATGRLTAAVLTGADCRFLET